MRQILRHPVGRVGPVIGTVAATLGWHHHVVLTAITYNFLQVERWAPVSLTFPAVCGIVQKILTMYLFAQRRQ